MTITPAFFDITLGNVITWTVMLIGAVAFWVKLKDQVDNVTKELEKQDKMLEEIRAQGSPSSRVAIDTVNRRLDDHKNHVLEMKRDIEARLQQVEKAYIAIGKMEADITWMRSVMQKGC